MNANNQLGALQYQLQLENTDSLPASSTHGVPSRQERNWPKHKRKTKSKIRVFFSTVLQIVGELLITAGLLIGLFVLWTVWWTNVTSGHEIESQAVEIQKEFGAPPPVQPAPAQEGEPPKVAPVGVGETIGIMRIPAFGRDNQTPIKEGVDKWVLDQGVFSHYKETTMPGEVGNFAAAAHRDIYGARMWNVDKLESGMPIIVETKDAFLVYTIANLEIVLPQDVYTIEPDPFVAKEQWLKDRTLPPRDPKRRLLTLTTCDPVFVASHRYIVYAEFSYWTKRSDGLPKELLDEETLKKSNSASSYKFDSAASTQVFTAGVIESNLRREFSVARPLPALAKES